VKILDFGLAKRVEAVAPGEETSAPTVSGHTEPGTVMGTLGYMSPEQVRGLRVDHRTDIFSFGPILYELLSGKKPFKRETASDTIAAILKEEPPDLSESERNISPALDHIVRHCMEKNRERRFQSARDIEFTLEETSSPTVVKSAELAAHPTGRREILIAAAVLVTLALAGFLLWRRTHRGGGEAGDIKRVAVLPFENVGAPEDDYFADGIADEIRGKLTSLPGVEVIARASSTPYKKTTKTPRQIADELDVRYLLTATVRWQKPAGASRVHVTPELVEVKESGAPASKWQQPFDAALTDVFQVQSDIASRVAQALGVALGAAEEKRFFEKPTQNLAAYDAFLRGEEASKSMGASDPPSVRKALGFYEQAVALDPGFAQAWAQVSRANSRLYVYSMPTPKLAERAREAAEKAVALAPGRSEGYLALGTYQQNVALHLDRALDEYAKGQRVAPANADLFRGTGAAERSLGRWDAAVEHFRQAEHLDPRSFRNPAFLGGALRRMRHFPEALAALDRGLALAPANLELIATKAMTFLGEGDLDGARAVLKAAPKEVEPTELVAHMGSLVWVLDEGQRELLLRLTPSGFDDDRGLWGLCLTRASALKVDAKGVHTYAEETGKAFEEKLRATPENAALHAFRGLALAYLGQKTESIQEGERAATLLPVAKDALDGPHIQDQLVRIYILVNEPEKALDRLEPLLKIPSDLSPGWLKVDPTSTLCARTPGSRSLSPARSEPAEFNESSKDAPGRFGTPAAGTEIIDPETSRNVPKGLPLFTKVDVAGSTPVSRSSKFTAGRDPVSSCAVRGQTARLPSQAPDRPSRHRILFAVIR
jgi:TolB-like protein/cytochrome c-type biogenesis protein CcmH/NrfG